MYVQQRKIHRGLILCPTCDSNKFNINKRGINKKLYSHKKDLSANKPVKGN